MDHTIGLIGCGGISATWINAVDMTPGCRIAMTYDVDVEASEKKAADIGARPAETLEAMLSSPGIDLVIIVTPTFTHADVVTQAAQAGKHIMCEKPMALNLAECQRMIDACNAGGVRLTIGHSLRFWGAFLKVRQLVADGAIGTPCFGQIHRMGASGILPAQPTPDSGTAPQHWRTDVRSSGGNIPEMFIHELDFSRAVFGEVTSVFCEATGKRGYGDHMSPLLVQALINFEQGKTATLRMGGVVGFNWRGAMICGTTGTLAFDSWDGPVCYYTPDADEPAMIPCDDTPAYVLELRDLIQAVESGGEPDNSGINGKRNIGLCLAMYRSIEEGRRFDFADGLPVDVTPDYRYLGPAGIR